MGTDWQEVAPASPLPPTSGASSPPHPDKLPPHPDQLPSHPGLIQLPGAVVQEGGDKPTPIRCEPWPGPVGTDVGGESRQRTNTDIRWGTIIPLIGGSALGCRQAADSPPLFHLTYKPFHANETHIRKYWPEVPYISVDTVAPPSHLFQNIDFVNTVCPCAGLSMLNTSTGNKSRGADALQNKWMFDSAEYVLSRVHPKCFWGENAPGLFTSVGEEVLANLKGIGRRYGYTFSVVKTNTELHGIPQRRVRTFYFFWRSPTVPLLSWKSRPRKNIVEYLDEIPVTANHRDWYMTEGRATERFRPYMYVLQKEGLSHAQFSKKFDKGTITAYLFKKNLVDDCIGWLKANYPEDGFCKTKGSRTFIEYLEHCKAKLERGLGYWDDSPRFVGWKVWPAMIRKSMISAVHPVEDRYLNVREMMHLMGLPHNFQIDHPRHINHIAQNVPVSTARDYAEEVVKFCRGKAVMSEFTYMKQDNTNQTFTGKEINFQRVDCSPAKGVKGGTRKNRVKPDLGAKVRVTPKQREVRVKPDLVEKVRLNPNQRPMEGGRNKGVKCRKGGEGSVGGKKSLNCFPNAVWSHSSVPIHSTYSPGPNLHHQVNTQHQHFIPIKPHHHPPVGHIGFNHYSYSHPPHSAQPPSQPTGLPILKTETASHSGGTGGQLNHHTDHMPLNHSVVINHGKSETLGIKLESGLDFKQEDPRKHDPTAECAWEGKKEHNEKTENYEDNSWVGTNANNKDWAGKKEDEDCKEKEKGKDCEGREEEETAINFSCYKCSTVIQNGGVEEVFRHMCKHFHKKLLRMNGSTTHCTRCGTRFENLRTLSDHVGIAHTLILDLLPRKVKCHLVSSQQTLLKTKPRGKNGKSFKKTGDLISSNRSQDQKADRVPLGGSEANNSSQFQCFQCKFLVLDNSKQSYSSFLSHLVTHHKRELMKCVKKPKICPICEKIKSKLPRHIGITHQKLLPLVPNNQLVQIYEYFSTIYGQSLPSPIKTDNDATQLENCTEEETVELSVRSVQQSECDAGPEIRKSGIMLGDIVLEQYESESPISSPEPDLPHCDETASTSSFVEEPGNGDIIQCNPVAFPKVRKTRVKWITAHDLEMQKDGLTNDSQSSHNCSSIKHNFGQYNEVGSKMMGDCKRGKSEEENCPGVISSVSSDELITKKHFLRPQLCSVQTVPAEKLMSCNKEGQESGEQLKPSRSTSAISTFQKHLSTATVTELFPEAFQLQENDNTVDKSAGKFASIRERLSRRGRNTKIKSSRRCYSSKFSNGKKSEVDKAHKEENDEDNKTATVQGALPVRIRIIKQSAGISRLYGETTFEDSPRKQKNRSRQRKSDCHVKTRAKPCSSSPFGESPPGKISYAKMFFDDDCIFPGGIPRNILEIVQPIENTENPPQEEIKKRRDKNVKKPKRLSASLRKKAKKPNEGKKIASKRQRKSEQVKISPLPTCIHPAEKERESRQVDEEIKNKVGRGRRKVPVSCPCGQPVRGRLLTCSGDCGRKFHASCVLPPGSVPVTLLWVCETCHATSQLCTCGGGYEAAGQYQQCRACDRFFHPECQERSSRLSKRIKCEDCRKKLSRISLTAGWY